MEPGPNNRLVKGHREMRGYILPPYLDTNADDLLLMIREGFVEDGVPPFAMDKSGKFFVSDITLERLADGEEDTKWGHFVTKMADTFQLLVVAGEPPVGCIEIPLTHFVQRGRLGCPGHLGYSLEQLFHDGCGRGVDVNTFADQYSIPRIQRYNGVLGSIGSCYNGEDGSVVWLDGAVTLRELFNQGMEPESVRTFAWQNDIPTNHQYHADGRRVVLPNMLL
jgi:hypothetical protein